MSKMFRSIDPGIGEKNIATDGRLMREDGSFNMRKVNGGVHPSDLYIWLVNITWKHFLGLVLLAFLVINIFFAIVYLLVGMDNLQGNMDATVSSFWRAFFFSVHTLTTVGYGSIAPTGLAASFVASFEALIGLMFAALSTGLLYGRFSKPSVRLLYSKTLLIAPYDKMEPGGTGIMFRVANMRTNNLIELHATVMLSVMDAEQKIRQYFALSLERDAVTFFPLTWTVVHPVTSESPFYQKTVEELRRQKMELLITIKGFDDTFSQTVHSRHSYKAEDVVDGARFVTAFFNDPQTGEVILDLEKVHEYERVS